MKHPATVLMVAFGSPSGPKTSTWRLDATTRMSPFIDGATMVATVEDDAGTIMVKRYRLVLPGEGGK